MDSLVGAIFLVLAQLQPVWGDGELLPDRWERLHGVARVIARAAAEEPDPVEAAAVLVALGDHETRFAADVGAGLCGAVASHDKRCDGGRARSYWQLWQVSCPELWNVEVGSEQATLTAARCALSHIRRGKTACGSLRGSLARYAVGHGCSWTGALPRARSVHAARRALALRLGSARLAMQTAEGIPEP